MPERSIVERSRALWFGLLLAALPGCVGPGLEPPARDDNAGLPGVNNPGFDAGAGPSAHGGNGGSSGNGGAVTPGSSAAGKNGGPPEQPSVDAGRTPPDSSDEDGGTR